MKYFLDTEFMEGFNKPFLGKRRHYIDLISIGIVCEDGRTYYALSNEFDLEKSWNKYDIIEANTARNHSLNEMRVYWLRENVLKPIVFDCLKKEGYAFANSLSEHSKIVMSDLQGVINKYGKPLKQIRSEICQFVCSYEKASEYADMESISKGAEYYLQQNPPEFYGYYADYDWVVFCSLFGRMIDLPKGFPMYCKDLKQMLDERVSKTCQASEEPFEAALERWKQKPGYPRHINEHNVLDDAKWNYELFKFLQNI